MSEVLASKCLGVVSVLSADKGWRGDKKLRTFLLLLSLSASPFSSATSFLESIM